MKKLWRLSIFLLILFLAPYVLAQQLPDSVFSTKLLNSFKHFIDIPQEKVYVHTDKPYYFAGDTIWLKTYLVNAITHFPGNGSRYAYVELVNRRNTVIQRLKLSSVENNFSGFIPLSKTIIEGDYHIRAYTNWMRNEDTSFFFSKNISIFAPQSSFCKTEIRFEQAGQRHTAILSFRRLNDEPYINCFVDYMVRTKPLENKFHQQQTNKYGEIRIDIPKKDSLEQYIYVVMEDKFMKHKKTFYVPEIVDCHVDFYPEGGALIADAMQKVAFKAQRSDGNSANVTGVILNQQNDTITSFQSLQSGIGSFILSVKANERYKAIVTEHGSKKKEYSLSIPATNRLALSTINRNDLLRYSILHTEGMEIKKPLYLLGHIRGFVLFVNRITEWQGAISLKNCPEGILSLVLLDGEYVPQSERLCFVRHDNMNWKIQTDKATYDSYSPVVLGIELKDKAGNPLQGDFSLSVTDNYAVGIDSASTTILSHLLLTSDLKGYIESPGYYFRDNTPKTMACLDNLMLTHGWSRFRIDKILKDKKKHPLFFMELGQFVSGRVTDYKGKPIADKAVNTFINKRLFPTVMTDKQGRFVLENISFQDTATIQVRLLEKDKLLRNQVKIDQENFPTVIHSAPYKTVAYQQQNEFIELMKSPYVKEDGMMMLRLPDVVIKANRLIQDRFSSYKIDDEEVIAQKNVRSLRDLIQTVPGFQVIDNRPYINVNYSRRPEMRMSNDLNNRNTLQPNARINYGPPVTFMLDSRIVRLEDLSSIKASDIVAVHKIESEVDAALSLLDMRRLEELYNQALEDGATAEELDELDVRGINKQVVDGNQRISGGRIILTSRMGNLYIPKSDSRSDYALLTGISRYKEFYAPQYDTSAKKKPMIDNRTTIYWQPIIKLNSEGKTEVRFYTATRRSRYTVILEGVTHSGKPCRYEGIINQ